jgi:hypothetical protein
MDHPDTGEHIMVFYEHDIVEDARGAEYEAHNINYVRTLSGNVIWNGLGKAPEFVGTLEAQLDWEWSLEDEERQLEENEL